MVELIKAALNSTRPAFLWVAAIGLAIALLVAGYSYLSLMTLVLGGFVILYNGQSRALATILFAQSKSTRKAIIANNWAQLQIWEQLRGSSLLVTGASMEPMHLVLLRNEIRLRAQPSVVEFGCGLSTLLSAREIEAKGAGRIVSFDHSAEWAQLCDRSLSDGGLSGVVDLHVVQRDESHNGFYRINADELPDSIDIVVVDGPPEADGHMVRDKAIDVVWSRLASDGIILLDDGARGAERAIADRWQREFDVSAQLLDSMAGLWIFRKRSVDKVAPSVM